VGSVAGALMAYFVSICETDGDGGFMAFGGAIGGAIGGILPDIFNPPTSMHHRAFSHSLRAGGGMLLYLFKGAPIAAVKCYERALLARESENKLAERFWLMLAGFAFGFAAGYLSHLALDLMTPRRLPY